MLVLFADNWSVFVGFIREQRERNFAIDIWVSVVSMSP